MLGFVGLNLLFDKDALNPVATNITGITNVTLQNGIMEHFYVSRDVTSAWTGEIPNQWVNDTIMNATFVGGVDAGNVAYIANQLTRILVKRKNVDDTNATWETLFEIPVTDTSSLNFTVLDYFNKSNVNYTYALVPVLTQNQSGVSVEVEGNYETSDVVFSQFDGVFICDSTAFYKFYTGVGYDNISVNQQVGVKEAIGSKYPIIVLNSNVQYSTGAINGDILPPNYLEDGDLDRSQIVDMRNKLTKFLCNKKPKILKDWNGNIWLVVFTDNPSIAFDDNWGMGFANINGGWTEVGDAQNVADLQNAGMLVVGGGNNANSGTI